MVGGGLGGRLAVVVVMVVVGAYSLVACLSRLTIDTHPFRDGDGGGWGALICCL